MDRHPLYQERLPDWDVMDDTYAGSRVVKERGDVYLPATSGMRENGYGQGANSLGQAMYDAYRIRAIFHDFVRETVGGLAGIVHRKPPVIEVPPALQPVVDKAALSGESLELLWRRVTEAQLLHGRIGLLVDVPDGAEAPDAIPYIAPYVARTIVNWDIGRGPDGRERIEIVVLDESGYQRVENLRWDHVRQVRVVAMSHVVRAMGVDPQAEDNVCLVGVAKGAGDGELEVDPAGLEWVAPSIASRTLDRVPFVFINPSDTTCNPDIPPLLGLAELALAIYRGEADYRQSLFMQGQDTLVRTGAMEEQKAMTGAGAIMDLPMGGTAEYIGVSSNGLPEQRQALENDKGQVATYTIQMLDTNGSEAESGEALRVRVSARTAKLVRMQQTAAAGLRDCLINAGRWLGLDEAALEGIVVTPNLDFSDGGVDAATVNLVMDAKVKGAPLSLKSIHQWLRRHEFTELEFEEEQEQILEEKTSGVDASGTTDVDVDPAGGEGAEGEGDDEEEQDDAGGGRPGGFRRGGGFRFGGR